MNAVDPHRVKCLFKDNRSSVQALRRTSPSQKGILFIDRNSKETSAGGVKIVLTTSLHKSTCFMNYLEIDVSHFKQDTIKQISAPGNNILTSFFLFEKMLLPSFICLKKIHIFIFFVVFFRFLMWYQPLLLAISPIMAKTACK